MLVFTLLFLSLAAFPLNSSFIYRKSSSLFLSLSQPLSLSHSLLSFSCILFLHENFPFILNRDNHKVGKKMRSLQKWTQFKKNITGSFHSNVPCSTHKKYPHNGPFRNRHEPKTWDLSGCHRIPGSRVCRWFVQQDD